MCTASVTNPSSSSIYGSTNNNYLYMFSSVGFIVNVTLLGLALFSASLPITIVFLSQAEKADSLCFMLNYLLTRHGRRCVYYCEEPRSNTKGSINIFNLRWLLLFSFLFLLVSCGDVYCSEDPPCCDASDTKILKRNHDINFRWFSSLFSLLFLLILCGDVELNPGPLGKIVLLSMSHVFVVNDTAYTYTASM